ncbi:MAG: hypothetical protein ACUVV6_06885 [Thermoplasmatota archaeon]
MGAEEEESGSEGRGGRPPPFIVYKNRLYVLSKKPPPLNHIDSDEERRALREDALFIKGQRPAASGTGKRALRAGPERVLRRPRPYIKGCFRHYSQPHPHLRPAPLRRRPRRRLPRSLE